jgi:hypothetical protein
VYSVSMRQVWLYATDQVIQVIMPDICSMESARVCCRRQRTNLD